MLLANGLEQFLKERREQLKGMASKYGVKLYRIREDYSFIYKSITWTENFIAIDAAGTYNPINEKGNYDPPHHEEADAFRDEATKHYKSSLYGVKASTYTATFRLNPEIKGLKCPPLEFVVPLIGKDAVRMKVEPNPGQITLLYFWGSPNERAVELLKVHNEILPNHPEWEGKLRIMEFNTDENFETCLTHMIYKNFEKYEQYWICKESWTGIWNVFPDKTGPFYMVVDKNCNIMMSGDPVWLKLETNLPKIMNGEIVNEYYGDDDEDVRIKQYPMKDFNYTLPEYRRDLDAYIKDHFSDFDRTTYLVLDVDFFRIFREGEPTALYGSMCLRYNWFNKFKAEGDRIKNDAIALFGNRFDVRCLASQKDLYSIDWGDKCDKCGKLLGKVAQYRCTFCKPARYYCVECTKVSDDAKNLEEMVHPHGLYYIQQDSQEMLNELKIQSVKINKLKKFSRSHTDQCKLCGAKPLTVLWKCANCIEFDICYSCFKLSKDPNNPKFPEMIRISKEEKHDFDTHIYVREEFFGMMGYYY